MMIKFNFLKIFSCALLMCGFLNAGASLKDYSPPLNTKRWNAYWISSPEQDARRDCALEFRKTFQLEKVPQHFKINVSADNRFILYVNAKLVARGPARGDFKNWHYHTIDISKYLKTGKNSICALVWDLGSTAPMAQLSHGLAFVLDGASQAEDFLATPAGWKVKKALWYKKGNLSAFGFTGNCDIVDIGKSDFGWKEPDFDDSKWSNAVVSDEALSSTNICGEFRRMLVPAPIPQMEERIERLKQIRRCQSIRDIPNDFLSGKAGLVIAPNTKCKILLDNAVLTNAYPILKVNGGKAATIKLRYAEALYDKNGQKGNRNDIQSRTFNERAHCDIFYPDGGQSRTFTTLWFRTYRYLELEIETAKNPLEISDIYGLYNAYPFIEKGYFKTGKTDLDKIWEVGWRTARLCANETYFDCPYYEQLQYVGDTRIQSLISLYVSGDERLMKHAINTFNASRTYEGITQARYPSRTTQFIPPFSLYWVSMVNDYAMHRNDTAFVKKMLPAIKGVLEWYIDKIDSKTGMLKARVPYWNFVDWANSKGWVAGIPPEGKDSGSTIGTLHLAYTLGQAAALMREFGENSVAQKYEDCKRKLINAAKSCAFDKARGLFSDYAGATSFSQHANIMAILSGAADESERSALMKKILEDNSLTQCTFYYRFYLTEALRKSNMGNLYVSNLKPWKDMVNIGLTTFAENPEPTRSDCHAWSSSPNYHFLSLVAGIMPAGYGFKSVTIEPNMGELEKIDAGAAHPNGIIRVKLERDGKGVKGTINLPKNLEGTFKWGGKTIKLLEGDNIIKI